MSSLPIVTPVRLLRALGRAGFFVHHVSGSHHILKHPDRPDLRLSVPYHNRDLKLGTLRSILRQAGLTVDQLNALL